MRVKNDNNDIGSLALDSHHKLAVHTIFVQVGEYDQMSVAQGINKFG